MRYFVPDIVTTEDRASSKSMERLGGLPSGLSEERWPKCAECGRSQSLLAQFNHDDLRLNLGREGRTLFLFQCNHDPGTCDTWDASSGANACVLLEPEQLVSGDPQLPADNPPVDNCVLIPSWLERDDGISPENATRYFTDAEYLQLDDAMIRQATMSTKLGSVPTWIQSADEGPGAGWEFLGQLDSTYSFYSPPQSELPWISEDPENWEGRTHVAQGPNFGDGGIAYLFANRAEKLPNVVMFWQCG